MKDPFPIGPPPFLVKASAPLCNALGLTALPLHVHEVIFATALYTFIHVVLSPILSRLIVPGIYNKFDKRTVINWNVHVVSFFQSVIICVLAAYALFADPECVEWSQSGNWEQRLWAYDGMTGFCQAMAYGYFIWDLYMCAKYIEIFGLGMLAHAISACTVFSFGFRPFVNYYAPVFLLYELSSPCLNIHWFCDKVGLTGSIYQAVNGAILTTTFFFCRLVWGTYNSYAVFSDIRMAIKAGHSDWGTAQRMASAGSEALKGSGFYDSVTGLRFSKIDVKTGDVTAYMTPVQYVPLWVGAAYLFSNITLNMLNVFWMGQMVKTIRKRFDPPWGTKGLDHKKSKQRSGSKGMDELTGHLGESEVPMDGELDLNSIEGDAVRMGGRVQEADMSRAVYADGHKGLEVGGKTLRSRRKA